MTAVRTQASDGNDPGVLRRRPLAVHVVAFGDPAAEDEKAIVAAFTRSLYARLTRGLRPPEIPVRIWAGRSGGEPPPVDQIPFDRFERNVVVLLVDAAMFAVRSEWSRALATLVEDAERASASVLPVAIGCEAHLVAETLHDVNCVPVDPVIGLAADESVHIAVLTGILAVLHEPDRPPALPLTFLCHAKQASPNAPPGTDGQTIAGRIRRYLYESTQLACSSTDTTSVTARG